MLPSFFLSVPGVVALAGIFVLIWSGARRSRAVRATPGGDSTVLIMQIAVSLIVLVAALYVIVGKPGAPDDHKWAYSIVGTIVGYWLRSMS